MKDWDTDKIIGAGLIVALIFYFTTVLIIAIVLISFHIYFR